MSNYAKLKAACCRGQGLIEYLVLTCLIAVSTIAIVSVVGANIQEQYAQISQALRGEGATPVNMTEPKETDYKHRGMDDFMQSARANRD